MHRTVSFTMVTHTHTHTHTQHKICHLNHFKAYSSMVLTFTPNHHCYPRAEVFHHPKLKLCTPLTITPCSSSHPSRSGDHLLPLCSVGIPGGTSDKEPACQCRRYKTARFDPWVRKGMATHFSILTWKVPWTEEPGRL